MKANTPFFSEEGITNLNGIARKDPALFVLRDLAFIKVPIWPVFLSLFFVVIPLA